MKHKYSKYLTSLTGIALSVFLFFYKAIDSYVLHKYSKGGTGNTHEELTENFIHQLTCERAYTVLFIFAIAVCTYYAITAFIITNKRRQESVSVVFGVAAFLLPLYNLFTNEPPGEGLEIFILAPLAFAAAIAELVLLILMIVNRKKYTKKYYFYIFIIISIVFGLILKPFYSFDYQILISPLISAVILINYSITDQQESDEYNKFELSKAIIAIVTVIAVFTATFSSVFCYKDIKERKIFEAKGYTYVGNDGKEKERAAFNIDGFYGYYAYKVNYDDYIEYKDGDYCVVEGYDFSSKDITLPYELNGKEAIYNNDFFAFLAKNKDKYSNIIIDEKLNFVNKDGFILDKEKQRLLYVYLGDSEEVTIPESTELILDSAFSNKNIRKIIFNDKIHSLRSHCFENCPMKELNIPDKTDTFAGVGNDNAEILGTAPELETVNIGKGCYRCNIGRFDKNVRANNEKEGRTLTVNTESLNDLLKLGTVLYNYENVVFNINYDKSLYYDNDEYFESYEIQHSDFYKEYQNCKNNTIYLSKSFDGKTYKTKIKINFAKGIKTDF